MAVPDWPEGVTAYALRSLLQEPLVPPVLVPQFVKLNVVVEALAGIAASIAKPKIANPKKFLIKVSSVVLI